MNTKFVYYVNCGKSIRLSKSDIADYLSKVSGFFYSSDYLRWLRRWPYDASRFALYSFITERHPEFLSNFINLYNPYGFE